jgi:O-glycosyl hydrolase
MGISVVMSFRSVHRKLGHIFHGAWAPDIQDLNYREVFETGSKHEGYSFVRFL